MSRSIYSATRSLGAVFLVLCGFGIPAEAATGPGGTFVFGSLVQPLTAPQTALGGLQACSDAGPEALRSNPSSLRAPGALVASASHQGWQSGLSLEWVGGVVPLGSGSLGFEASAVHAGSLPAYTEDGVAAGTFTPIELIVGAGYARGLVGGLRGGVSAHMLSLGGGGGDLRGIAFSLGLEFASAGSRLAVALRNLGSDLAGERGTFRLPGQIAVGLEREIGFSARTAITGVVDRYGEWSALGGIRLTGPARVSLLCGAAYARSAAFTPLSPRAGVSVPLRSMLFSYSYAPADDTGSTHHFSLQIPPG